MRRMIDSVCKRCGHRETYEGISLEAARMIADTHFCADGTRVTGNPLVLRNSPGPGERLADREPDIHRPG